MTCFCPKCTAQIDFDASNIPAEGSFTKCSECGSNLVISKESFARRALYKSNEISCAECGSHPGSSIYCQNCHAIYPDFLVTSTSSTTKKQLGKILAILSKFNRISVNTPTTVKYTDGGVTSPAKAKGFNKPSHPAQLAAVITAITLILSGGGYFWYQEKTASTYTENYVRALFVIKSAKDVEMKIGARLAADMRTGASSTLTASEQKSANAAKSDADLVMAQIGKIPSKFMANDDALKKLSASYSNLHTTITSPSGGADIYSAAVKKMDDDFKQNASTLKAGLPEKISAKLNESTKKYKSLQDF